MNAMGIQMFWCVAQITLLSTVAGILYWTLRRFGPALGAFVSLTALVFMSAVTVFTFSPWPNWVPAIESKLARANTPAPVGSTESPAPASAETTPTADFPESTETAGTSPAIDFAAAIWERLTTNHAVQEGESGSIPWLSYFGFVLFAVMAFGFLRVIAGLVAVYRYRTLSRPVSDPRILELLDVLAAKLGCVQSIEVRESSQLTGAATVGWRRPLILLPVGWRAWDEQERRAVLAHELAHIHHRDFLRWLAAQIGLALHFYHPLAHWLCGCLRLDQELVADSTAAQLIGGRQSYLQTLAQIALEQSEPRMNWAAQTFLPTRRTFLRRIEMLRDSREWFSKPPRSLRWLATAVLCGTGLMVLGLRGPAGLGTATALAQQAKTQNPTSSATQDAAGEAFNLGHVPRDTFLVVAVRPAKLLAQPALASVGKLLSAIPVWESDLGLRPDEVQAFTVVVLPTAPGQPGEPIAVIARCADDATPSKVIQAASADSAKSTYGTAQYLRRPNGAYLFQADSRTIICARNEAILRRCIVAGPNGAKTTKWASGWNEVARQDAAALANITAIRPILNAQLQGPRATPGAAPPPPGPAFNSQFAAFAPLWQHCNMAVAGLALNDRFSLKVVGTSSTGDDAMRVHDTLKSALTLGQNLLSQGRQAGANSGSQDSALMLGMIDLADQLLDGVKVERNEAQVVATVSAETSDFTQLASLMAPALLSARQAAGNFQSLNNLKQLAIAFHNFHDTYGKLPPAVIYGPNNVPRSWRIELLPYIEAADVYNLYRKDEPWDSEHNKKLLDKMPSVFRDPADAPNSVNSSYFVITGPGTVFEDPAGISFSKIPDGTSNTLLVVQAKRSIPWTKPEDIVYAPDQPLPKLGGWVKGTFLAALCDGSARQLPDSLEEKVLRLLITRADQQPIPPFNP